MPAAQRRQFLRHALRLGLTAPLGGGLGALQACHRNPPLRGMSAGDSLVRATNATTGLPLLRLPKGFRYFSFAWTGDALNGGGRIPPAADGMGVVASDGDRITLIRNQEVVDANGAFAAPDAA